MWKSTAPVDLLKHDIPIELTDTNIMIPMNSLIGSFGLTDLRLACRCPLILYFRSHSEIICTGLFWQTAVRFAGHCLWCYLLCLLSETYCRAHTTSDHNSTYHIPRAITKAHTTHTTQNIQTHPGLFWQTDVYFAGYCLWGSILSRFQKYIEEHIPQATQKHMRHTTSDYNSTYYIRAKPVFGAYITPFGVAASREHRG